MLDFHAHSTASDGALAPAALISRAHARGLRRFALTDHDTLAGLPEALARGRALGLEVVPGIEISATWEQRSVHVLGYYFDPDHPELRALLDRLVHGRARRNRAILARLADLGVPLDESVLGSEDGGTVGRPHIARALVARGVVADVGQAFDRYLKEGRPAHVERAIVSPEEAARVLHAAGGVAVLAHPLVLGADPAQVDRCLARAARSGLDGVEVHYSGHSAGQVELVGYFARKHGLLASGGSDFHEDPWPEHPPLSLDLGDALAERAARHRQEASA